MPQPNNSSCKILFAASSSSTGLGPTQAGSPVWTHLFHFLRSCTSASSSSAAFRSSLMQSFHLLLGLPLFLFPTSIAITLLPTYLFSRLTTWPNHLNLPSLIFTPQLSQYHLSNKIYENDEQLKNDIDLFFSSKFKNFFEMGIKKLIDRWREILENEERYFKDY